MKQLFVIFLSCTLLLSATGLVKISHFCSAIEKAIECGDINASCASLKCCKSDTTKSNCCHNNVEFIENDLQSDYLIYLSDDLGQKVKSLSAINNFQYKLQFPSSIEELSFGFYKPPPKKQKQKLYLAFSSFLC